MLLKATFPSLVDQIAAQVNRNQGQFKVVQMIGSEQQDQRMLMNSLQQKLSLHEISQ